jgi:DNA polymerase III sliding clamp (beta) subunit (PCNA family)
LDATITGDWFTITFKFTDGKYPLLDRFITDARAMAIVNRKQLLKECKRLLPAANKKYKGCRVAVNEVVALDVCNGFTGSVDCESIADCNFGINLAYMIDALSSSADEMITIAANLESESNDVTDTIQFQSTKHTTIVLPMLM